VNQSVVLVTDIQLAQAEMLQGETLELSANVLPSDATTTTIVWSLKNAGSTEATLSDNRLTAPGAGTAVVTATIDQGDGIVFAKDFQITVHTVFVAVTDIADIPTELNAGDSIVLSGTVMPENATNKNIFWAMNNPGTTRATLRENTLTTSAGGVITLTATIRNGLEIGEDFVKRVEITVSDEGQTPDTPVFKVNLPPSLNVVVGNQAALSVIMEESNAEEVRYAWYKDDVLIPEATEATLTLEAAALTDAGRYKVVVTNVLNEEEATAESVVSELRVTAAPLTVYQVLFGSQQTYRGGNIGLMFGTSIPFEEFNSVSINGVIVPPAEYDVRRGSTIVELSAHYLSLLRNGTYNMRINAVNGYAEVTFFVMSAVQPTQPTQPTVPSQTVQPTFSQPATVVPPQGTTTPLPTTVITGVGPTQTIPGSPQTGERSSLVYILSGAGLLLLAAVFIVIAVRRRRADEDEFGEEYPPDEDEFSDELPPDEDTDSK
jgi:LPXTG-motif cell wall-anchored protein